MNKKMLTLMTVLLMAVGSAFAQVIITDEDVNHNRGTRDGDEIGVMVPMQNVNMDQWKFAPLGSGVLLLAGLGAAYLVGKRKKQ